MLSVSKGGTFLSIKNRQILTLNVTVLFYRYLREERSSLKNCIERLCLKVESSFFNKMQKSLCIREERSSLKFFNTNSYF